MPDQPFNAARLRATLSRHEGRRHYPYVDTVGKTSIGVGRNLDDRGLTDAEIDFLLSNDIRNANKDARTFFPELESLNGPRQEVLINMAFNLGLTKLTYFRRFKAALERRDYASAALEMLDSLWATQVGDRANELSRVMETGVWEE